MPALDPQSLDASLDRILEEHDALLNAARGFGLRLGSRLPKGTMALREAQNIVANFAKNTDTLNAFVSSMYAAIRTSPPEFRADLEAVRAKADKALAKFVADQKAAQAALALYEDALVGENFQDAFQAVRLALIDLDPEADIDIDYRTHLHLDKDPAFAQGLITIQRGTTHLYDVIVGYRASDDTYWGSIKSTKKYKTFERVVTKIGTPRLPAFVRDLVTQVLALSRDEATNVFGTRARAELTLVDTASVEASLRRAWQEMIAPMTYKPALTSIKVAPDGKSAVAAASLNGTGWNTISKDGAYGLVRQLQTIATTIGTTDTKITVGGKPWSAQAKLDSFSVTFRSDNWRSAFDSFDASNVDEAKRKMTERYPEWVSGTPIATLRLRAQKLGIDPTPYGRSSADLARAIQAKTAGNIAVLTSNVEFTFTLTASTRAASTTRQAGGSGFSNYVTGKDPGRAFDTARESAGHDSGRGGYSGTIYEKPGYTIRSRTPMSKKEAVAFANKDIESNDKWGDAFAIPVSEEKVLAKDTVTVTVEARDAETARRKGILLIKATGRVPHGGASIVVDVPAGTAGMKLTNKGARVSTWEVTGVRKQSIVGEITGWLFYGIASS